MAMETTLTGEDRLDCVGINVPAAIDVSEQAEEVFGDCRRYLLGIEDKAERDKLAQSLQNGLSRIAALAEGSQARAELFGDGAPLSFTWRAGGFMGGLLFHGPHDGYGSGASPTFSVTLTPAYGWRIHT
jgi:hypothetical protein